MIIHEDELIYKGTTFQKGDLDELQDVIEHKKMMVEKYPEFEDDKIALNGLEKRFNELKRGN